MHKIQSAAKHAAWYRDDDDEKTNYNPFRKLKNPNDFQGDDVESARSVEDLQRGETHLSDSAVDSTNRRLQHEVQDGPSHASTMPPLSAGSGNPSPLAPPNRSFEQGKGASEGSDATTSNTLMNGGPSETAAGQPRKRKLGGILGRPSHAKNKEKELERRESRQSRRGKHKFTFMGQARALLGSPINLLLFAAPVGIALHFAKASPIAVFVANFIAIIPLAALLSYCTEEIALRTGETIGGLLNATFGNAVELIVSIIALVQNEILIVQTSLIGSVLSNLLLVMGMCFFFGGWGRNEQYFNEIMAQTASSLLSLAIAGLIIPTAYFEWATQVNSANAASTSATTVEDNNVKLSRGTAVLSLLVYGCYLYFQLNTHISIYNAPSQKAPKKRKARRARTGDAISGMARAGANLSATAGGNQGKEGPMKSDEEEREVPQISLTVALVGLTIVTVVVALCAEFLVAAIDSVVEESGISKNFVGLILLPIVGNAAEHATAVTVACKDKMDLAIGVAVGSSMQIALFVLPFIVTLGWIVGKPAMDMSFDPFQVIVLFVSVLLVNYLIGDGKSNWLEGILLIALYLIIAIAAWFYPQEIESAQTA